MTSHFKQRVKATVKHAAMAWGHLIPGETNCSRILTYHSVGRRDHEMNVNPSAFREQIDWLAANTHPISLSEAAQGKPGVAVTFDDGYRDNLTEAAPVLVAHAIPATVFLVAGRLGGFLDHDNPADSSRLMTWDQVRELESMGIAIGAHTLTHPRLSQLNETAQRQEIVGCIQLLEENLGHAIQAFAYPYGSAMDYNDLSVQIVRESGLALACSNRYGVNSCKSLEQFALRRIWIDASDTMETFQAKVQGHLDFLRLLEAPWGMALRRLLNRVASA